jgi:hypothetical protein
MKIPPKAWKAALLDTGTVIGLLIVLAGWGMFVGYAVRGIEVGHASRAAPGARTTQYLLFAIGATAVGVPLAFFSARRTLQLLLNGIDVPGLITRKTPVPGSDWIRIDIAYTVEGREHTKAVSVVDSFAKRWHVGDTVTMRVHPRNPKRSLWKEEACPEDMERKPHSGE